MKSCHQKLKTILLFKNQISVIKSDLKSFHLYISKKLDYKMAELIVEELMMILGTTNLTMNDKIYDTIV